MTDWTKIPVIMANCEICQKEVEQDLWYHGQGKAGFEYSCGCTSQHEQGKPDIWTSKDGQVKEITK